MNDIVNWFQVLSVWAGALLPAVVQWVRQLPPAAGMAWAANFVVCMAVAHAYFCRTRKVSAETSKRRYIVLYAVAGSTAVAAAAFGAIETFGPWLHIALIACYAADKAFGARRWHQGPPPEVRLTTKEAS